MDTTKAQKLTLKIQAFLDNGPNPEMSRLEKDLLKSYILQLYETVTDENAQSVPVPKVAKPELHVVTEIPPVHVPEPPKKEVPPVQMPEITASKTAEVPAVIKRHEQEAPVITQKNESKPIQVTVTEPVKETPKPRPATHDSVMTSADEALQNLFDLPRTEDLSGRSTHVPISSIESALGLNARIFTLNELFGGDRVLFDTTCQQLNELPTFAEARNLLMEGAARRFKWADQERIRMAEDFIRIVARRYPKS